MMIAALALLLANGPATPKTGPISVEVGAVKMKSDDVLSISLSNHSDRPVEIELDSSPCSSNELATLAFLGKGAIGTPVERVGIVAYVLPVKKTIAAHGTYSCVFSITSWYDGRWRTSDRAHVKIFWSFEPLQEGIYDKTLYGGVVRLP